MNDELRTAKRVAWSCEAFGAGILLELGTTGYRCRAFLCAASIALAATGCHVNNPYKPTDPTQASHAASSLNALFTLEDMQATMTTAIEKIGQQISAIAPGVAYVWRRTASRAGCNPPYRQSGGRQVQMPKFVSEVPIPEQNWKQAFEFARQAAAELDAQTVTVFKDAPNDHDVQFSSKTGTTLRVGSHVAALITGALAAVYRPRSTRPAASKSCIRQRSPAFARVLDGGAKERQLRHRRADIHGRLLAQRTRGQRLCENHGADRRSTTKAGSGLLAPRPGRDRDD